MLGLLYKELFIVLLKLLFWLLYLSIGFRDLGRISCRLRLGFRCCFRLIGFFLLDVRVFFFFWRICYSWRIYFINDIYLCFIKYLCKVKKIGM